MSIKLRWQNKNLTKFHSTSLCLDRPWSDFCPQNYNIFTKHGHFPEKNLPPLKNTCCRWKSREHIYHLSKSRPRPFHRWRHGQDDHYQSPRANGFDQGNWRPNDVGTSSRDVFREYWRNHTEGVGGMIGVHTNYHKWTTNFSWIIDGHSCLIHGNSCRWKQEISACGSGDFFVCFSNRWKLF